jgi:hypothetical protein
MIELEEYLSERKMTKVIHCYAPPIAALIHLFEIRAIEVFLFQSLKSHCI